MRQIYGVPVYCVLRSFRSTRVPGTRVPGYPGIFRTLRTVRHPGPESLPFKGPSSPGVGVLRFLSESQAAVSVMTLTVSATHTTRTVVGIPTATGRLPGYGGYPGYPGTSPSNWKSKYPRRNSYHWQGYPGTPGPG
eukprot:2866502-Rhodomonas_salina.1